MAPPDRVDRLRHYSERMLAPLPLPFQAACRAVGVVQNVGRDFFHEVGRARAENRSGGLAINPAGDGLWSRSNPDAKRQIEMGKTVPHYTGQRPPVCLYRTFLGYCRLPPRRLAPRRSRALPSCRPGAPVRAGGAAAPRRPSAPPRRRRRSGAALPPRPERRQALGAALAPAAAILAPRAEDAIRVFAGVQIVAPRSITACA